MKTAEQWIKEPIIEAAKFQPQTKIAFIESIRLDAFKAGMGFASKLFQEQSLAHLDSMEGTDWHEFMPEEFLMDYLKRFGTYLDEKASELTKLPMTISDEAKRAAITFLNKYEITACSTPEQAEAAVSSAIQSAINDYERDLVEALKNMVSVGMEFYAMECGENGAPAIEQANAALKRRGIE